MKKKIWMERYYTQKRGYLVKTVKLNSDVQCIIDTTARIRGIS